MAQVRIAGIQFLQRETKSQTYEHIRELVSGIPDGAADLIMLPEMWNGSVKGTVLLTLFVFYLLLSRELSPCHQENRPHDTPVLCVLQRLSREPSP